MLQFGRTVSSLYPLSPFDSVYLDCDTEQQVDIYEPRFTKVMAATALRVAECATRRGAKIIDRDECNWSRWN